MGHEITRRLLDAGYSVALAGRTLATLERAAAGDAGSLVHVADVASAPQVEALFAGVVARWGRVDLLVNNAGTFGPAGEIDEISPEAWQQTVGVNLTGSFLCAQAAVRAMKAQQPRGGRMVNIGNASTEMTAGLAVAARQADGSTRGEPTFDPAHVAEAVLSMARLPLTVNVQIMATRMPYIGRG